MPVRLTPSAALPIPTKQVRMDNWDASGEWEEHIDVLVFLRADTREVALKAGRRNVQEGTGRPQTELNEDAYLQTLFGVQVKGWRLFDPHGKQIPFTPENVASLPWDVRDWLHDQILRCGGSISTRDMVVETGSGQAGDFKSPPARVGARKTTAVSDPV